jgi:hypothetical protein
MAHFAEIDENNIVKTVIVVSNESLNPSREEDSGIEFLNSLYGHSNWLQTSYNGNIRKNYAGIGFTYSEELDAFIPPKEYDSWILNEETCQWEPPVAYPEDGNDYEWNEDTVSWNLFQ